MASLLNNAGKAVRDGLAYTRDQLVCFFSGGRRGRRQAGALVWRRAAEGPEFLLVTSRRSRNWIFPKGGVPARLTPWDAAAREAFEEAGVTGRVEATPVGCYRTWRIRNGRRSLVEVDLYPLEVEAELESWQEEGDRERRWATLAEVRTLVPQRRLWELAARVAEGLDAAVPGDA